MDKRYLTMNRKTQFSDQVDFRTPPYLFYYLNNLFGKIEFDGACESGINNLAIPLRLESPWPNGVIYSNPPFDTDSIIKWIKKGFEHSRASAGNVHLMVIPNKLCYTQIQKESLHLVDKIIFLGGRVDFTSIYSTKGGASRSGSIILIQKVGESGFDSVLLSDLKLNYLNSKHISFDSF